MEDSDKEQRECIEHAMEANADSHLQLRVEGEGKGNGGEDEGGMEDVNVHVVMFPSGTALTAIVQVPAWKVSFLEEALRRGLPIELCLDHSRKTYKPRYQVMYALRWERDHKGKITQVGVVSKLKTHLWFSALAISKASGTGLQLYIFITVVFWAHILGNHEHCGDECPKNPLLPYQKTKMFKREVTELQQRFTKQRGRP